MSVQESKNELEELLDKSATEVIKTMEGGIEELRDILGRDERRLEETKQMIDELKEGDMSTTEELEKTVRTMINLARGAEIIAHVGIGLSEEEKKHFEQLEEGAKKLMEDVGEEKRRKASQAIEEINTRLEKADRFSQKERLENFKLN